MIFTCRSLRVEEGGGVGTLWDGWAAGGVACQGRPRGGGGGGQGCWGVMWCKLTQFKSKGSIVLHNLREAVKNPYLRRRESYTYEKIVPFISMILQIFISFLTVCRVHWMHLIHKRVICRITNIMIWFFYTVQYFWRETFCGLFILFLPLFLPKIIGQKAESRRNRNDRWLKFGSLKKAGAPSSVAY